MLALGMDIGGSGIKSAIVDTETGEFVSDRIRTPTPQNPSPEELLGILRDQAAELEWHQGPAGIGFPGVIRENVIHSAVNLGKPLLGLNLSTGLEPVLKGRVRVLNDADAAGFAEMRLGAGLPHARSGGVLLLTIGTGIGTVFFHNGMLIPNLEFGHLEINGTSAETYVSERARKVQNLSWKQWTRRFNAYLDHIAFLLQPDLIILGGGGVKKAEKFVPHLEIPTPWEFARFGNRAGIIGAAAAAADAA
ncbi:MAG: ROK family protein [Oceanipulchritudo sp.]